jgi:hypothetical protein
MLYLSQRIIFFRRKGRPIVFIESHQKMIVRTQVGRQWVTFSSRPLVICVSFYDDDYHLSSKIIFSVFFVLILRILYL